MSVMRTDHSETVLARYYFSFSVVQSPYSLAPVPGEAVSCAIYMLLCAALALAVALRNEAEPRADEAPGSLTTPGSSGFDPNPK